MSEFTAIDFETAVYAPNSAISIGLVKYRDYRPVDTYYSLIRPPRLYIRRDFTDIPGLTVDDVRDAPDFEFLWENEIKEFIGDTVLVAHNAPFDMGVLCATLDHYDVRIPDLRYFCSCSLARQTWPGLESYALTALAKKFGIVYDAHNALEDAMTCGKLVQMSARKFKNRKGVEELLAAIGLGIKN
jgi:DNA polymerase-3 subunit epsilon